MALVTYGQEYSSNVIFSDPIDSRYHIGPWVLDSERPYIRTTRQINRRPISSRPQSTTTSTEDPFDGLDPILNNQDTTNNNRPFNNNQWGSNGNNQEQSFQGNNGNRPSQNQNSWGSNGSNQEQNFQNNNGNNRPTSNPNRPNNNQNQNRPNNNQNQNRPNSNQNQNRPNNNQNQNRPNNNQNQFNNNQSQNQNQGQTSNNSVSETLRQSCNSNCNERILNEYNPVCGSDSMTYQNRRFLDCVASCGIRMYIFNFF